MMPYEFKIMEELDGGALYRLWRTVGRDGRAVLLKTAHQGAHYTVASQRLKHEYEVYRHLRVEGLVRAIDLYDHLDHTYLAFEDHDSLPLDHVLARGPLDIKRALQIAASLARTLAALHLNGYIHCDIQPSNILINATTVDITLHGLGIATRVPLTVQGVQATELPGIFPAYASPEFSGRTNRLVDYRTDFYSLGVLLFKMLTGQLPFVADDPLELIHAHVAKRPPLASAVNPEIPDIISGIIRKLLEKPAEDRYQGGRGLLHDLERCLRDLDREGRILPFGLAENDPPSRFELPQKFYGRDSEIKKLQDCLENAAQGTLRLMMVTGYPGIGKSSLVRELQKSVFAKRGWFVAGKYDSLERENPYSGIREALRDLWRRLLAEEPAHVVRYRQKLEAALGQNLGVIVDVTPELRAIVGETLPVSELEPLESKNRLHLCLLQTLRALASEDHPLVLFLDDLQWADPSSLELIEGFLEKELGNFLLLGAYRDREVNERHPLLQSLNRIAGRGIKVETLTLGPLDLLDVRRLVADALRSDMEGTAPLADLVFQKTSGNAFFSRTFLTTLYKEGLLFLNQENTWSWDMRRIAGIEITENVIDLAARNISQVQGRTRATISLAAVLGHPIVLDDLAAVSKMSVTEVEHDLIEACRERILLKNESGYQFEHDRLQESAYNLIPESSRKETHLSIGRLLAGRNPGDITNARLFVILDHLNRALDLIEDPDERVQTARLNLTTGRLARAAAAFPAAHKYFMCGLRLLPADMWLSDYELTLALHTEAAEAAYLVTDFREADHLVSVILSNARNVLDKIPAYETQIAIAYARLQENDVFRITLEVLKLLGVEISEKPTPEALHQAALDTRLAIESSLASPSKDDGIDGDAENLAALRLLTQTAIVAGLVNLPLYFMIARKIVDLAIRDNKSPEAPVAYVMAGGMLCFLLDDYENGCRAGDYGMMLLNRSTSPRWQAFCHFLFSIDINCWRLPFISLADDFTTSHRMGLESGDLMTASFSAYFCCEASLHAGIELGKLETLIREYLDESKRIGTERVTSGLLRLEQAIRTMKKGAVVVQSPDESLIHPGDVWQAWHMSADQTVQEVSFCHEMMLLYFYRNSAQALEVALKASSISWVCLSGILPSDFFICLIILDALRDISGRERERLMTIALSRQEKLRLKARTCPVNHQHKLDLVEALRLRLTGDVANAREFYDRAIEGARRHNYCHEEALANELAAEFYLDLGREQIAAFYVQAAVAAYERWGSHGKVDQLYEVYPTYLSKGHSSSLASTMADRSSGNNAENAKEIIDISSIEGAAATLAKELDMPKLLENLLGILFQNAGAQRGFLLREEEGHIFIEAGGSVDGDEETNVNHKIPIEKNDALSHSIVRYVSRTHETVVIGDATQDERFAETLYIIRDKPKSILCAPVLHLGKTVAILYLENNRTRDAFNGDRLAAIQVISTQAAVALENARLLNGMKLEVLTRRQAEKELRRALDEVAMLKDRLHAENAYLREEIQSSHDFDEIVGKSEALRKVLQNVAQVAATDTTVLILGETGTGKELVARAIHNRSLRKDCTLVKVNCTTLPANLIESELFGYEKGAFTGAHARKTGRFELADGGTIFLDEIGELPLELQSKLLRVLQEGEFERVGSATTQKIDVRVIAATNRDLKKEAEEGTFRADLYYRLSVFPIELPPLRNRQDDIPLLAWFMINKKQGELGKCITKVSKDTMDALINYPWPGNIRELENIMERSVILSHGATLNIDFSIFGTQPRHVHPKMIENNLNNVERHHILEVLEQCGWRVKGPGKAAEQLGLKPSTLFFRMKKLGIERPKYDGRSTP